MRKISILNSDRQMIIDDEYYELMKQYRWTLHSKGYAICWERKIRQFAHRLIMCPPAGKEIDHINGDGLDNRKQNLRICTHKENLRNVKKHSNNTSGYKGVERDNTHKRWNARIRVDGKKIYLGCGQDVKQLAELYNKASIKYFGSFARINEL